MVMMMMMVMLVVAVVYIKSKLNFTLLSLSWGKAVHAVIRNTQSYGRTFLCSRNRSYAIAKCHPLKNARRMKIDRSDALQ
jgi:hypothetical protein